MDTLKMEARRRSLWNLFLPASAGGPGLSNAEYAPFCEAMGWSPLAAEACNCSAPDSGNMETLLHFGSADQKRLWLQPLMQGTMRSAFLMTEPRVASSDARNIATRIERDANGDYIITGRKWWATGALHPNCSLFIVMGLDATLAGAPEHSRHTILLVPASSPGIDIVRPLTTFGYDDAPHGHAEIALNAVRVPPSALLGEPGAGFRIGQARLGPGRIHHCMRAIGLAERCLEALLERATDPSRVPFGRRIGEHATVQVDIAESRSDIDAARALVLVTAALIDAHGVPAARKHIALIKVAIPRAALRVIDRAIQVHGAAGVSQDTFLARAWAGMRTLRIADG